MITSSKFEMYWQIQRKKGGEVEWGLSIELPPSPHILFFHRKLFSSKDRPIVEYPSD